MTALADAATEYLSLRCELGLKLDSSGRRPAEFVAFAKDARTERVTHPGARLGRPGVTAAAWGRWLGDVRGSARLFQCLDPTSETAPPV